MRLHAVLAAVFGLAAFFVPPADAADSLALPLGAAAMRGYFATHGATTLPEMLAALPPSMTASFVLMRQSRSLQQATPTRPRQILFGPDARFLLAISGVPTDPRYATAEFAEFDAPAGRYRFGTVTFAPGQTPAVATDVERCSGCHGRPARPIWGQYPDWPGAYADNDGKIATSERPDFAAFLHAAPDDERYRTLRFAAPADGSSLTLVDRRYPYANTDFNHELGNTVALGVATRLRAHPDYARWRWAALATSPALSCIDSAAWSDLVARIKTAYDAGPATSYPATRQPYVQAFRLLGVDPVSELSLELLTNGSNTGTQAAGTTGAWQTGAYQLQEAVAFQLLLDAQADDAALRAAFAPQLATIDYIRAHTELTGEARATALRASYAWFPFFDVFDPLTRDPRRLDAVCGRLRDLL